MMILCLMTLATCLIYLSLFLTFKSKPQQAICKLPLQQKKNDSQLLEDCQSQKMKYTIVLNELATASKTSLEAQIISRIYTDILMDQIIIGKPLNIVTIETIVADLQLICL